MRVARHGTVLCVFNFFSYKPGPIFCFDIVGFAEDKKIMSVFSFSF